MSLTDNNRGRLIIKFIDDDGTDFMPLYIVQHSTARPYGNINRQGVHMAVTSGMVRELPNELIETLTGIGKYSLLLHQREKCKYYEFTHASN
jgi:hypothetical protein